MAKEITKEHDEEPVIKQTEDVKDDFVADDKSQTSANSAISFIFLLQIEQCSLDVIDVMDLGNHTVTLR